MTISSGQYLLEALFRLGPVRSSDMGGRSTVDWDLINHFADATQRISEPWEKELIMDMADAYLSGNNLGRDPLSYSPLEMLEVEADDSER